MCFLTEQQRKFVLQLKKKTKKTKQNKTKMALML